MGSSSENFLNSTSAIGKARSSSNIILLIDTTNQVESQVWDRNQVEVVVSVTVGNEVKFG